VALPVLVYSLTSSPLLTGVVAAFEALPYLMLGLVAGALADRWNRRRVMVAADLCSAVALGSIPVAAALGSLTVPHVLVVAFVAPAVFVFFDAANFGAVPMLVGRPRIATANSAIWSAGTVVEIVVPAAGGALLALVAPPSLIALDAVSFVASAFLIRAVSTPLSETRPGRQPLTVRGLLGEAGEGLRFLAGHPNVRSITIVGACQALAGGAFVGQMVVWADRRLGVAEGNWRLGVMFSAWGIGGLIASLALPRLVRTFGAPRVTLVALPVSGTLSVLTALAWSWMAGAVLMVAWGVAYMMVVTNAITYRQQVTPEALMSRVNTAGRMLSFGVGFPLGGLMGGLVAQVAGPVAGMLAGSVVALAGTVFAWMSPLRTAWPEVEVRPV
jgi:MFS family permease